MAGELRQLLEDTAPRGAGRGGSKKAAAAHRRPAIAAALMRVLATGEWQLGFFQHTASSALQ